MKIEKIFSKVEPSVLLHMIIMPFSITEFTRVDVIPETEFIQLSVLNMRLGKTFKPHHHIEHFGKNTVIAQESWVCLNGMVKCEFFDLDNTSMGFWKIGPGEVSITLRGGHNYESLEDETIVLEFKTGPYTGQENDKKFI